MMKTLKFTELVEVRIGILLSFAAHFDRLNELFKKR